MPEITEVCYTALYLNKYLNNSEITNIEILGGRYKRHKGSLKNLINFKNNLPLRINNINSKGKFMWFELSNNTNNYYIMNTFGLSGSWRFSQKDNNNVAFTIKKKDKNIFLYFNDPRNFGTIQLTPSIITLNKKLNSLGDDLLKVNFTNKEFYERIEKIIDKNKKNGNKEIAQILMDQKNTGIGSGIGNYLSAEILYNAKISPHTKLKSFYEDRLLSNKLAHSIKYIIKLAFLTSNVGYMEKLDPQISKYIEKTRNSKLYNFLPDVKIGNAIFKFNVYRQTKDPHDNTVITSTIVNGRKTYWVPTVQS